MEKPKRKTYTSTAVKKRYHEKTYKQFTVRLRYDADADLIAYVEARQAENISPTDLFRTIPRE